MSNSSKGLIYDKSYFDIYEDFIRVYQKCNTHAIYKKGVDI